ncbi:HYC_CC_PP family protein [Chitinophaga tropicalis]
MKRISSLILVIIYLSYVAGLTIYHHYCMGELVKTSIFSTHDSFCEKCGMKKHSVESKGCCKDIATNVKTSESHLYSSVLSDIGFSDALHHELTFNFLLLHLQESVLYTSYPAHAPPFQKDTLFLQYCNFRI